MKEQFSARRADLVAIAKDFPTSEFDQAAPEEVTKRRLSEPFFHAMGCKPNELWELIAPERLEADRREALYGQTQKAPPDQCFLAGETLTRSTSSRSARFNASTRCGTSFATFSLNS